MALVNFLRFFLVFEGAHDMPTIGTLNEEGVNVDLYIPRKCHATNSLIASFDYSSIQIAVADIDPNGVYSGQAKTFCIAGYLRGAAESDHAINRLSISAGIIRPKSGKPPSDKKKKKLQVKAVIPKAAAKGGKGAPVKGGAKPAAGKPAAGARAGKPAGKKAVAAKGRPATAAAAKTGAAKAAAPAKPAAPKTQARPKSAPAKKQ
jgi:small subunit ribosomal protein S21e